MRSVWLLRDMDRVDTGDEAEGHVAGVFATQRGALDTRKLLEARTHPDARVGYAYHFEIEEVFVHERAFSDLDIARGCADELVPPRAGAS
jgi:hypothetical protein